MSIDNKVGTGRRLGLKIGTIVVTSLFAFLNYFGIGCKAEEVKPYEETKEPEAVVETYQEPEIEEEPEIVVEEVKVDPLQEKISQYDLEGLMTQIQQKDPELYEHYTTGVIDEIFSALKNVLDYTTIEKILEKRPTIDSLGELNNIISEFDKEDHRKNYVENSFKKSYAIIVTGSADHSTLNSLLPMWLCDQLNIAYMVINNTNDQAKKAKKILNGGQRILVCGTI